MHRLTRAGQAVNRIPESESFQAHPGGGEMVDSGGTCPQNLKNPKVSDPTQGGGPPSLYDLP